MAQIRNMTEGNPAKLFLLFSLPLMAGNVFQQLYTVVDTMVVGRVLGTSALAAVGTVDWFNWMFLAIITGLTQGFSILIAQKFGEGDLSQMRKAAGNALVLSGILAVILILIGEILVAPMLRILRVPEEVAPMSAEYLRVIFGGMIVVMAYNILAALLRALGDSKTPLYSMIVAASVNVGLDLLFVAVFGWGVRGAAIATVIAQGCSAVFCLTKILKIEILAFCRRDFMPELRLAGRLLFLGMPMALQNILISIGGMIVQTVVNGFGVLFIAAFTATNKLYGLLEIAAISFGYAMTTYTGQNLGARKLDRIRKGVRSAVLIAVLTAVLIGVVMLLVGKPLLGLFISGSESDRLSTIAAAYEFLSVMSISLPILYVLHVVRSSLQGMGRSVMTMISGVAEFCVRTVVALTLPAVFGYYALFWGEVFAWIGADVVLIISYVITIYQLKRTLFGGSADGGVSENG